MLNRSQQVAKNANFLVQRVATKFLETVVDQTPVDSGKAITNWLVGVGYSPRGYYESLYPGTEGNTATANRRAAKSEGKAKIKSRTTGRTIYIANNAPYIQRLNDGYSAQAPAGFIEAARVEAEQIVSKTKLLE